MRADHFRPNPESKSRSAEVNSDGPGGRRFVIAAMCFHLIFQKASKFPSISKNIIHIVVLWVNGNKLIAIEVA